jgi:hypothetical protein
MRNAETGEIALIREKATQVPAVAPAVRALPDAIESAATAIA